MRRLWAIAVAIIITFSACIQADAAPKTGVILIGDSRFVGMDSVCKISSMKNKWVIAKVSMGHTWLVDTALPKMKEIQNDNPDVKRWKVVVGLGVNDLHNCQRYIDTYSTIKGCQLYLLSGNPVEAPSRIPNSTIADFNKHIKASGAGKYIDTYTHLMENGFSTADGVHYKATTYKTIWKLIKRGIKK